MCNFFFASLKSLKTESDPELDPDPDPLVRGTDPDPHKNVTDHQHYFLGGLLRGISCESVWGRGGATIFFFK